MERPSLPNFRENTQQNRIDFLQTDLDLCSTFVDLAYTELESMKDRHAALRVITKAEQGHATMTSLLLHTDDGPDKDAIRQQLIELRAELDRFQERLFRIASDAV